MWTAEVANHRRIISASVVTCGSEERRPSGAQLRYAGCYMRICLNVYLPDNPQGSMDWLQLIVRGSGGRAKPSNTVQLERPEYRRQ